jgi:hypothetical protein
LGLKNGPAAYLRVSTEGQGRSGLGLEAQRATVGAHAAATGGLIVSEFVEVESGRKRDRPQLAAALAACRTMRATLVIAKLDRLARNVAFISNLMESGVEFVVADMPIVNRLTIHILAAVAEEEARMISARTRGAFGSVTRSSWRVTRNSRPGPTPRKSSTRGGAPPPCCPTSRGPGVQAPGRLPRLRKPSWPAAFRHLVVVIVGHRRR